MSFVSDVNFVMVVHLVFSKMWRIPYPFGFCNPVWIYGRKINDDDDNDDDDDICMCTHVHRYGSNEANVTYI